MRRLGNTLSRGFLLLLFFLGSKGQAAVFSSGLADAQWRVDASIFECALAHPLAGYGQAEFFQRAGEAEIFRISQTKPMLPPGSAELQALLPTWHSDPKPVSLGQVTIASGAEALRFDREQVKQLQELLEAGRRLIIVQRAPVSTRPPVRVLIEPVHFVAGIKEYRQCLTRLLPVNFQQVERTAIYFPESGETLSAQETQKLDTLVRYMKADPRVSNVVIDGHTDSEGIRPENLEISKNRAEMIAAYLIDRKISPDKLTLRWHGERYPVATNKTAAGRAQNRRVTLRLERD